jgi:alpha-methylacyl-CoA racemase
VLEQLGLGFERIHEANPRACLVSITGYGREGDMARKAGHDINYLALSGWLHELVADDSDPTLPNVQIGDILGGALTAAFGAVSAVLCAKHTGSGCHVDISMTATLVSCNVLPLAYAQAGEQPPVPGAGLLNGGAPCYGLYHTGDGRYLAVGALESKFWERLCVAIGRPDLASLHWQSGQKIGGEDARAVRAELQRIFAQKPLAHWEGVFADVDCCVTPVLRMDEVLQRGLDRRGIHTVTGHNCPRAERPDR